VLQYDFDTLALKAEVALLRGHPDAALRHTAEALSRAKQTDPAYPRLLFVDGAARCEMSDEQRGLEQLERAATHAKRVDDVGLFARTQLQLLERSADAGAAYDVALPRSVSALRAVRRSGDKGILADAHIGFARLEARRGYVHVAARHLKLAESLVNESPNRISIANIRLTLAIVASIEGDVQTARELSEQAEREATEAGWDKGCAIAAANLAFYAVCLADFEEADRQLDKAEGSSFKTPNYKFAVLDTRISLALARGDFDAADKLWSAAENQVSGGVSAWYRLRASHVRVRALVRQKRFDEAVALAEESAGEAARLKNEFYTWIFNLSIADAKASAGSDSFEPLELWEPASASLGLIGAQRQVLAKAFGKVDPNRAQRQFELARRILATAGNVAEWVDETRSTTLVLPTTEMNGTFEDSGTLFELAGYPHVLAREAYALLELSGAVEAMALVARGADTTRTIAAQGWTDAEATAAVAKPADRLVVTCGVHRDETWEIVAQLKPGLNDRCTGVAIRKLVDTAVTLDRYRRDEKQRTALWPADTLETDGGLWVSEQMTELLSIARRIAPSDISVLLTGETGTGKEVLARAVHRASGRSARPFVPFNCTAVPREMLESQLFGYRKGAFTGAQDGFEGVIRAAAGGTLFLDEIAEIGPELQPKLLRFLETREVHGLGEPHPVTADVRVIAATNADLETLVAEGRFREDLFYRLNVVRLRLPPLRERREEIPPLIDHYLRLFAEQHKKGRLTLDDETLEYLVLYRWPGNVRQLVNELSRIAACAEPDSTITPALLSPEVQASRKTVRVLPGQEPEIRVRLDQPLGQAVDAIERVMVVRALERAHGNYENAARLLGISRKGLFLKRRRWGMQRQAS
jgi:DNA-binding NtrC family response regulator